MFLTFPGLLVVGYCLHQIGRGRATMHWATAPGIVGPRPLSRSPYFVPWGRGRFSYTCRIGEREYRGRRIWLGADIAFSVPDPALTWLGASYPPGASVQVFCDPVNPRESVLRPGVSPGTYVVAAAGLALTLVGLGAPRLAF